MHGHVTLLSWTPDMEAMIASGGRISTMDGTADEIRAKSLAAGKEKNEKLIGKVLSSGHTSVLEHGYVNLAFENVSVLAEQFLIEFRLASFTVKSRRYVDFPARAMLRRSFRRRRRRHCLTRRSGNCSGFTTSWKRQACRGRMRGLCCRTASAATSSAR